VTDNSTLARQDAQEERVPLGCVPREDLPRCR